MAIPKINTRTPAPDADPDLFQQNTPTPPTGEGEKDAFAALDDPNFQAGTGGGRLDIQQGKPDTSAGKKPTETPPFIPPVALIQSYFNPSDPSSIMGAWGRASKAEAIVDAFPSFNTLEPKEQVKLLDMFAPTLEEEEAEMSLEAGMSMERPQISVAAKEKAAPRPKVIDKPKKLKVPKKPDPYQYETRHPDRADNTVLGDYTAEFKHSKKNTRDKSRKAADTHSSNVMRYKDRFESASKEANVPVAILMGIASRESGGGALLGKYGSDPGWGDHNNAWGIMQVDKRYHKRDTSAKDRNDYAGQTHITQAANILRSNYDALRKSSKHRGWSTSELWRGAIVAYNSGVKNVQTLEKMDVGTTGNDYGDDVWARSKRYMELLSKPKPAPKRKKKRKAPALRHIAGSRKGKGTV